MLKKTLTMMALAACLATTPMVAHAADAMMSKDAKMMSDDKMASDKMMMKQQMPFSDMAFAKAEKSGNPFLVAFHKKGCPICAKQQQALNTLYADPANARLKVFVVDYDNDTETLKKFNVGRQSTLILYKGGKEISRTEESTSKDAIMKQLNDTDAMMMKKDDAMMMNK